MGINLDISTYNMYFSGQKWLDYEDEGRNTTPD